MRKIFSAFVMAALLSGLCSGCATVDYVGDTYAPTSHVDMYYDAQDIHRPYKVMGHMTLDEDDFTSTESMQSDFRKEAMDRGADAVLMAGMHRIQTGTTTQWQDLGKTKGKHPYEYGTATTQVQEKKEMTGSLLKYTDLSGSLATPQ